MTTITRPRAAALALALILSGGVAACGGDDSSSADSSGSGGAATSADRDEGSSTDDSDAGSGDGSNDDSGEGRAFDSTDDAVITAATSATGAERGEWDGSTVRIVFGAGSAENPVAWTNCLAIESLIADDEAAVLVFPDGELRCEDRPGS